MIIPLRGAQGAARYREHPVWKEVLWTLVQSWFFTTELPYPNSLKRQVLRWFGARVGSGVIIKPRVRILFPWKLEIGSWCWIGEGVYLHNHETLSLGHDVVISQDVFLSTGSHEARTNMDMVAHPIHLEPGVWVCARSTVTHGVTVGSSALVLPGTTVYRTVKANTVVGTNTLSDHGERFSD